MAAQVLEWLFLVVGAICVIVALVNEIVWLLVIGIILMVIGGIILICIKVDEDGINWFAWFD